MQSAHPESTILLVDTYDTLRSGVPNAIKLAREMKKKGHKLLAIRLDSGDLAYLAKKSRKMLDEAGLHDVKIVASNQLDEYLIKSLKEQKAPDRHIWCGYQPGHRRARCCPRRGL